MRGFNGSVHSNVGAMFHHVPISNSFDDGDVFIGHAWSGCEKDKFIQQSQEVLPNILIFNIVLVLP